MKLKISLLISIIIVFIWSAVNPNDRLTWYPEVAPAVIAVFLCAFTYKKFPLTDLLYILIWIHCIILLIGGHYTYAEVPLFSWIRDTFNHARNNYDKIGHFAQGFIPAIVARELLLRTSPLKPGKWLIIIILLSVLGISATYELIEWITAEVAGADADSFLSLQGDDFDTQKDMFFALLGGITALLTLSKLHDKQLKNLQA